MKHLFILNPVAGGGRRISVGRASIVKTMEQQADTWEIYETQAPEDATRKVKQAAEDGTPLRVYACGGDGTLNECVNGAIGHANVAVTTFPMGTGNDFIKTFSKGREHFYHLPSLLAGRTIALDVIDVGGRYGINICSVGLDARIGADVHKYSNLPLIQGKRAYVASLIANVMQGIANDYTVTVGGKTYAQQFTLLCACNGRSYGGTFTPVPDALPDDGLLDILLVKQVSRLKIAQLVGKYAKGRYREIPQLIEHVRDTSITIQAAEDFTISIDGEILTRRAVTFTLQPKAVQFIIPQAASFDLNEVEKNVGN